MTWRRICGSPRGSPSLSMKENFSFTQLLVRTAQQTYQLVPSTEQDDLGEGVLRGAVESFTAAVNDGVPANAVVMRRSVSKSRQMWAAL